MTCMYFLENNSVVHKEWTESGLLQSFIKNHIQSYLTLVIWQIKKLQLNISP